MQWSREEFIDLLEVIVRTYHAHAKTRELDYLDEISSSYMARLGGRLIENGYPILPIMPGTKKPGRFTCGPGATIRAGRVTAIARALRSSSRFGPVADCASASPAAPWSVSTSMNSTASEPTSSNSAHAPC